MGRIVAATILARWTGFLSEDDHSVQLISAYTWREDQPLGTFSPFSGVLNDNAFTIARAGATCCVPDVRGPGSSMRTGSAADGDRP
jgi:hypothetical protein